ncbi:MAG: Ldh family oxidoreductase [Chloroflexota bacterium]|nr:Ldh family oxidoreductase [Chloroflexota bacterium]
MADYRIVEPDVLEVLGHEVFVALGTPVDIAQEVAAHLVRANLAGHDSHGAIRIPQYATMIVQGAIRPAARPSIARQRGVAMLVDAGDGFGQFATAFALERAIERAAEQGAAVVAVRRANHIGRVGDYTEKAARRGYVAEVTVGAAGPGIGGAAPFGGAARFLGTNPWSLGIPTADEPVVVDFATTVVAEGKVRVARAKREALPPGCIVDQAGRASTDPEDFYAGGMLLPFGGHKGYGLALAAALFGGLAAIGESDPSMAGAAAPPTEKGEGDRIAGVFLLVVDPGAFGDREAYPAAVSRVTTSLKRVTPSPGTPEVLLPGEPEARTRRQRLRQGIALPEDTWQAIAEVASGAGVTMPPTRSS